MKEIQSEKAISCMIPTIGHLGEGKMIKKVKTSVVAVVGMGERDAEVSTEDLGAVKILWIIL